ncbi:hypothetical protein BDB01DRAFT_798429 [Pilobolus umbonatus]|nr:hypothetical protein BDB01DRAFT_798429 [Pilobolus umbonatus]
MRVLSQPIITLNFNNNPRKRSRSPSDSDSHYLKKRLISTTSNADNINPSHNIRIDDMDEFLNNNPESEDIVSNHHRKDHMNPVIDVLHINGSSLPMEQRPGESIYRVPSFIVSNGISNNKKESSMNNNGSQLILYTPNYFILNPYMDTMHEYDTTTELDMNDILYTPSSQDNDYMEL